MDGGRGQAASQTTSRPQVELLDRGATSEKRLGDPSTLRRLKGQEFAGT